MFRGFFSQWKPSLKLVEANFRRNSIFLLIKNDFLAGGNRVFLYFSDIPTSDNDMFQESTSFRLVEIDFRANNGFRKKKEKL